jgi:hypothetical protein
VGPRAVLDAVEERKNFAVPGIEPGPSSPWLSVIQKIIKKQKEKKMPTVRSYRNLIHTLYRLILQTLLNLKLTL